MRKVMRRALAMEILEGHDASPIQRLGALFLVVVPLPGVTAAAFQTVQERGGVVLGDFVSMGAAVLILGFVAVGAGAFVAGGVVPGLAQRVRREHGDMELDRSYSEPFRGKTLVGFTLFGWLMLVCLILAPLAILGWMLPGAP